MTTDVWPGRPHRATVTRLYVSLADVEPELPYPERGIRLYRSDATQPLHDATECHERFPYFFEIRGVMGGEAMVNLGAAVHAIEIWSDTCVEPRVRVAHDGTTTTTWEDRDFGAPWGHYADLLPRIALDAIAVYGARLARMVQANKFNPLSNALRLYFAGLRMLPSDVALVTLVSALEGVFTTSEHKVSARFRRGVAAFLESNPTARQELHDHARDVYSWRSRVVHGNELDPDGERTAIMLSEELTPSAEILCRRTFRRIFEERLDVFLAADATCLRRQLYELLWRGETLNDALATLQIQRGA